MDNPQKIITQCVTEKKKLSIEHKNISHYRKQSTRIDSYSR